MDDNVIRWGQFQTPSWAAHAIVEHLGLDRLKAGAVVVEPSCGTGRFLDALPSHLIGIGVDIDCRMVAEARKRGHRVLLGDFRTVALPITQADAIIGNPPFQMKIVDGILERALELLAEGSDAAFILPCYAFQTASRVIRWNKDWSMAQEMMPRNLFPGLSKPLMLARFTRDPRPRLSGLILYHESHEIESMPAIYQRALREGRSGWKDVIDSALTKLGGSGELSQIYNIIAPQRPTTTEHWKAKVRQQLQKHYQRVAPSSYAMAS